MQAVKGGSGHWKVYVGGGGGGGGVEVCPAWKLLTLKLCVHNANNNVIYTARL